MHKPVRVCSCIIAKTWKWERRDRGGQHKKWKGGYKLQQRLLNLQQTIALISKNFLKADPLCISYPRISPFWADNFCPTSHRTIWYFNPKAIKHTNGFIYLEKTDEPSSVGKLFIAQIWHKSLLEAQQEFVNSSLCDTLAIKNTCFFNFTVSPLQIKLTRI